jgi:predicted MFS family arabinose efflux permease
MVAVLIAGAFTTALNIMVTGPLLTAIATEFEKSEAATGQVATLTAAASGVTALVVAPSMDRWSRRTWLRFECSLLLAGTVFSALAPSFEWLLLGRTVAGIGIVFTGQSSIFLFALIAGSAGGALFMCGSILTLDSYPEGRGAAMSLQSAAMELGGAFGTAGFGAALAMSDDYAATYRLLGVAVLFAFFCLFMSARNARPPKAVISVTTP